MLLALAKKKKNEKLCFSPAFGLRAEQEQEQEGGGWKKTLGGWYSLPPPRPESNLYILMQKLLQSGSLEFS